MTPADRQWDLHLLVTLKIPLCLMGADAQSLMKREPVGTNLVNVVLFGPYLSVHSVVGKGEHSDIDE